MVTDVQKYCQGGGAVFDPLWGTNFVCSLMAVSKVCLRYTEHLKFVCGDIYEEVIRQSIPSLLEVFTEQLLSDSSDIVGDGIPRE